jgi:hypothetical protein
VDRAPIRRLNLAVPSAITMRNSACSVAFHQRALAGGGIVDKSELNGRWRGQ